MRTLRGKSRGRREVKAEESDDIWKEAPESRTHEDVPDCVGADGGGVVEAVAVAAEPVEEKPEEASMRLRAAISWSVRDIAWEATRGPLEEERLMSRCF